LSAANPGITRTHIQHAGCGDRTVVNGVDRNHVGTQHPERRHHEPCERGCKYHEDGKTGILELALKEIFYRGGRTLPTIPGHRMRRIATTLRAAQSHGRWCRICELPSTETLKCWAQSVSKADQAAEGPTQGPPAVEDPGDLARGCASQRILADASLIRLEDATGIEDTLGIDRLFDGTH
jgi:hypothetical protein